MAKSSVDEKKKNNSSSTAKSNGVFSSSPANVGITNVNTVANKNTNKTSNAIDFSNAFKANDTKKSTDTTRSDKNNNSNVFSSNPSNQKDVAYSSYTKNVPNDTKTVENNKKSLVENDLFGWLGNRIENNKNAKSRSSFSNDSEYESYVVNNGIKTTSGDAFSYIKQKAKENNTTARQYAQDMYKRVDKENAVKAYENELEDKRNNLSNRYKDDPTYKSLTEYTNSKGNKISATDLEAKANEYKGTYDALVAKYEQDGDANSFLQNYNKLQSSFDELADYQTGSYADGSINEKLNKNKERMSEIANTLNEMENGEFNTAQYKELNQEFNELKSQNANLESQLKDIDTLKELGYYDTLMADGTKEEIEEYKDIISHYKDNVLERTGNMVASGVISIGTAIVNVAILTKDLSLQLGGEKIATIAEVASKTGTISQEDYSSLIEVANNLKDYNAVDSEYRQEINETLQKYNAYVTAGTEGAEQFVYEGLNSTTNFLTKYLLLQGFSLAEMAVESGTQKYFDLMGQTNEDGTQKYTTEQCVLNGALTGWLSYATEKIGMDKFVETLTGGAGKYISGHALNYIASSAWQNGLAEGSEELIEGVVDPIIDAITLKEGLEYNAGDIFKSTMLGFFSGSITGVAGATKYVAQTSKQYNQIKSDMATLNEYRQYATPEEKVIIDNELRKGQDALNAFEDVSVLSKFVKTEEDIETMNSEDALKTTSSALTPTVEISADYQNSINNAINSLHNITQGMLTQNGINMDIDQYETLNQQQREDTTKVAQYARELGLDVRFDTDLEAQYIQNDKGISKIGVNGMLENDTIVINPKSLTPQTSILAHEVTHVLKQANKYEQFVSLIQDNADFKGALNRAREKYSGITDDILSEGVAMYVESNLSNPKFINKLINYDNSLAYKIYDNVKAMFSSDEKTVQENAWRQAFEEYKTNGYQSNVSLSASEYYNGNNLAFGQYSLKDSDDTTKTFAYEVENIAKGNWNDSNNAVLVDKNSPSWMIDVGYNDLPILMTKTHIESAMGKGKNGNQHNVSQEVVSNLPSLIKDPIAVFNYKGNDLLGILKATDNDGKIVVVAIKPNGIGRYANVEIDTNFLLSAYGRNEVVKFFDKVLNNGNVIYSENSINKKEVLQTIIKYQTLGNSYMARPGLQLSDHRQTSSNEIITNENKNVKYSLPTVDSTGAELSPQQQEYFKDSKIVDENNNLRVVYHGTYGDFNIFDRTKTRANMDIQGNFFTPWELDAQGYGPNVNAYYLNIKNPASESVAYKALNMFKGQDNAGVKAREYLISQGYDGVNNSNEEYIAFYPEQIKKIDNYNPTSKADIRYDLSDDIETTYTDATKDAIRVFKNSLNNALGVSLTRNKVQLKDAINNVVNDVVQNGSVSEESKNALYEVAWENAKVKNSDIMYNNNYDPTEIRRYLKSGTINFNSFANDIPSGKDRKSFMARNINNFSFSNSYSNTFGWDTVMGEFVERYPGLIDAENIKTGVEFVEAVSDVLETLDKQKNGYSINPMVDPQEYANHFDKVFNNYIDDFANKIKNAQSQDAIMQEMVEKQGKKNQWNVLRSEKRTNEALFNNDNNSKQSDIPYEEMGQDTTEAEFPKEDYVKQPYERINNEQSEDINKRYDEAKDKYGIFDKGMEPRQEFDVPTKTDKGKVSQTARTIAETEELINGNNSEQFKKEVLEGRYNYVQYSNKQLFAEAKDELEKVGAEVLYKRLMSTDKVNVRKMAEMEVLMQEFAKNDDTRLFDISAKLTESSSNAGQILQYVSMIKRMSPQAKLASIESKLDDIQTMVDKKMGDKTVEINIPENLKQDLLNAKTPEDIEAKSSAIMKNIKGQIPKTTFEKVVEKANAWRFLSMLSSPSTHVRNMLGNTTSMGMANLKDVVGSVIEGIVDKTSKNGIDRTKTLVNRFSKKYKQAYKLGNDMYDLTKSAMEDTSKYEASENVFGFKPLDWVNNKNSELLDKEDFVFSRRRFAQTYARYLMANKVDLNNVSEEIKVNASQYAMNEAQKATFRDFSEVASWLNKGVKMGGVKGGIIDALLPFRRTPINILRRGVEYSPIGLLSTITKGSYDLHKGNINVNEYVDGLSAGLTGTGIALLGALLASLGIFRTKDDDKDRKQQFDEDNGEQDYSIDLSPLGIDGTYTIDWANPFITPLSIGADLFSAVEDLDGENGFDALEAVYNTILKVADPIVSTTMLSNLQSSLKSYAQSEGEWIANIAGSIMSGYVSQYFPTVMSKVARAVDDTKRTTYPNNGYIDKTIKSIEYKTPFLSKNLEPSVDLQGNEVKNVGGNFFGRLAYNLLSPGYYKDKTIDQYDEELYRLYQQTGDTSVFPSSTTKSTNYDSNSYDIKGSDYTEWNKTRWAKESEIVNDFINSESYQYYTDEERADTIKSLRQYAGEVAKEEFLAKQDIDYSDSSYEKANTAESKGLEMYEYFLTKNYYNDLSGDDKKSNYIDYLNEQNMSDDAKNYMYSLQYGDSKVYGYVQDLDIANSSKFKIYEIMADTTADVDENGETVKNSKAQKIKEQYEELGVYDAIIEYVNTHDGVEYSSFGLTKSIVNDTAKSSSKKTSKNSETAESKLTGNYYSSLKNSSTSSSSSSNSSSGSNKSNTMDLKVPYGNTLTSQLNASKSVSQNGGGVEDDWYNAYTKIFRKSLI